MLGFIIAVLGFIYLISRIHTLEKRLDEKLGQGNPFQQRPPALGPSQTSGPVAGPSASNLKPVDSIIAANTDPRHAFIPAGALQYRQTGQAPRPTAAMPTAAAGGINVAPKDSAGTEFAVGSKLLTGVGVVAVLLGVIFFLRYAFDRNLISETMRVALGIIFGLILGGIGHLLRKKYQSYGFSLVGAGLGIVYISIYSAYAFYDLINVPTAFFVLFLTMLVGAGLSVLYNSLPLISYSLVGAFLIPLILPMTLSVHVIFGYLVIVNLGLILIARYRTWTGLPFGGLLATSLVSLRWVAMPQAMDLFAPTCAYLTIIFLIYLVTMTIHFFRRDDVARDVDGFLLYAIPSIYFGLNALMLKEQDSIALLLLLIGVFYAIASTVIRVLLSGRGSIKMLSDTMLSIAVIAIAGATLLHFQERMITIMWALEAVIILIIGTFLHSRNNRMVGVILSIFALLRGIFFDMTLPPNAVAIFNDRTLIYIVLIIPFITIWISYKYFVREGEMDKEEAEMGAHIGALAAWLLAFAWMTSEILKFITIDAHLYLPLAWSLFALGAIALSFAVRERALRYISYILLGITAFYLLMSQWNLPSEMYAPIANIRVLSTIILLATLCLTALFIKFHKDIVAPQEDDVRRACVAVIYFMILWVMSVEVLDYFNVQIQAMSTKSISEGYGTDSYNSQVQVLENTKRVVLSAAWLVYAIITLAIGIIYRSAFVRYFSIGLFAVTIVKIFLYDTANLSDIYRFVSFILLGVILLLAGFAYHRFKNRIIQFVTLNDNKQ